MAAPTTTTDGHAPRAPRQPVAAPLTVRTARRNRVRIVAGAAIMLASAFAAAVLYSDAGERSAVLQIAHRVAAGEMIEAGDFTEALVASDVRGATVPASQAASLVGRVAAVDLVPGSLLAPGQVSDRSPSAATDAVVGAVLDEGYYPRGVGIGDRVLLVEISNDSDTAETSTPPVQATVVSVVDGVDIGSISISLAVPPADARRFAVAAARGRLTIVLAPA